MQNHNSRRALKRFFIISAIAFLVFLAGLSETLVENVYSKNIYLGVSVAQRFLSSLVPFPLGDFIYLLLIGYVLWKIVVFFRKLTNNGFNRSNRLGIPLGIVNFILILYIAFKVLWGLNYSRPSISERLNLSDDKYTTAELVSLGGYLVEKLNEIQTRRIPKSDWTIEELQRNAKLAYDKLRKKNSAFNYPQPVVKPVLFSWLITKIGIEGYYNPLSGEANVNMRLPSTGIPFVTCHEIAHQLGIGREDEANLLGYLTSIHSDDINFRYSGYYSIVKNVLFEIRFKAPEAYEMLFEKLNTKTITEIENDRNFWRKYNNQMFGYLDVAFDKFLKLNNQPKGTDSYQDIVLWLTNYHKKELKAGTKTLQP